MQKIDSFYVLLCCKISKGRIIHHLNNLVNKVERNVTGIISHHKKDTYNMYPLVSGEFTPMEYHTNASNVLVLIMKADTRK